MAELEQLQASAEQTAILLKAMGDPRWLLVLCMFCGSPGTNTGELACVTGLNPSATFQHLACMREESLIENQHGAQCILYSIKNTVVNSLVTTLETLCCP